MSLLVMFLPPVGEADGAAIFEVSEDVGSLMPWLLLLAAVGSQSSAIVGATSSRSDMLMSRRDVSRKLSFPIILIPATLLVIFVDLNVAVNLASRVFAAYFCIQISLATLLTYRNRHWPAVAGFVFVGIAMLTILLFGLPL